MESVLAFIVAEEVERSQKRYRFSEGRGFQLVAFYIYKLLSPNFDQFQALVLL